MMIKKKKDTCIPNNPHRPTVTVSFESSSKKKQEREKESRKDEDQDDEVEVIIRNKYEKYTPCLTHILSIHLSNLRLDQKRHKVAAIPLP